MLLQLPGHRKLGNFALDQMGQTREVTLPVNTEGGRTQQRRLRIQTYADGPIRVLRVADVTVHPQGAKARHGSVPLTTQPSRGMGGQGSAALGRRGTAASADVGSAADASDREHSMGAGDADATPKAQPRVVSDRQRVLQLKQFLHAAPTTSIGWEGASSGSHLPQGLGTSPLQQQQQLEQQQQRQRRRGAQKKAQQQGFALDVRLELFGIGVSLVSPTQELLYASCSRLCARLAQGPMRRMLGVSIGSVRVENTLQDAQHRLMLASPVSKSVFGVKYETREASAAVPVKAAARPALGVLCTLWCARPGGVLCFEALHVQLAPLAVSLEGMHLKLLRDFYVAAMPGDDVRSGAATSASASAAARGAAGGRDATSSSMCGGGSMPSAVVTAAPRQVPPSSQQPSEQKIYIEDVSISEIQICISFAPGSWFTPSLAAASIADVTGSGDADKAGGSAGSSGSGSGGSKGSSGSSGSSEAPWWGQLALSLAHAEGAWLRLAPFRRQHPLLTWDAAVQVGLACWDNVDL